MHVRICPLHLSMTEVAWGQATRDVRPGNARPVSCSGSLQAPVWVRRPIGVARHAEVDFGVWRPCRGGQKRKGAWRGGSVHRTLAGTVASEKPPRALAPTRERQDYPLRGTDGGEVRLWMA